MEAVVDAKQTKVKPKRRKRKGCLYVVLGLFVLGVIGSILGAPDEDVEPVAATAEVERAAEDVESVEVALAPRDVVTAAGVITSAAAITETTAITPSTSPTSSLPTPFQTPTRSLSAERTEELAAEALMLAAGPNILSSSQSRPTVTQRATATPQPTRTSTATSTPTNRPTNTPLPSRTPTEPPTWTPVPTQTALPTNTPTPPPTWTPVPTNTLAPVPTSTPVPPPAGAAGGSDGSVAGTEVPAANPADSAGRVTLHIIENAGRNEILGLRNDSGEVVDISGAQLTGSKGDDRCTVPSGVVLQPEQEYEVATGDSLPGALGMKCGDRPIWNNDGETIFLRLPDGSGMQIETGR